MKNQLFTTAWGLLCLFLLANWSHESSVENGKKNRINFYGTITTRDGKQLHVENISIARLYKNIPVYDETLTTGTQLKTDPKKGIITKIDLTEIHAIETPHPHTILSYKRKGSVLDTEYIAIDVISSDPKRTRNQYLIQLNRRIVCDEVNQAGPVEKLIPFNAIEKMVLEGYHYRDNSSTIPHN